MTDTTVREKIADIIWGNCHDGDNGVRLDYATDAILAALPDLTAPQWQPIDVTGFDTSGVTNSSRPTGAKS